MSTTDIDFPSLVHERGFRLTPQRQLILDAICEAGEHVNVNEIYRRVRKHSKAISLPTIYRTLDFLCELRVVVAMQIGRHILYEVPGAHPHHHTICRNCGNVGMIPDKEVHSLFSKIEMKHGFWIDMDHMGLFGLCAKCKQIQLIS
jgi:Fe2+ or Zn2+ uptake regulation protein